MSIGFWQIAIVVVLVVLLFGRGKSQILWVMWPKVLKVSRKGCLIIQKILKKTQKIKTIQIVINSNASNWMV